MILKTNFLLRSLLTLLIILLPVIWVSMRWGWRTSLTDIQETGDPILPIVFLLMVLLSFFAGFWLIHGLPVSISQMLREVNLPTKIASLTHSAAGLPFSPGSDRLTELTGKYETIRLELPAGDKRTRMMDNVVIEMRNVARATPYDIAPLLHSKSPGERLAAVVMLQVQPRTDWETLSWLAERIAKEKPFIGREAARALLLVARISEISHRPDIFSAIRVAQDHLKSSGNNETTLRGLLLEKAHETLHNEWVDE